MHYDNIELQITSELFSSDKNKFNVNSDASICDNRLTNN